MGLVSHLSLLAGMANAEVSRAVSAPAFAGSLVSFKPHGPSPWRTVLGIRRPKILAAAAPVPQRRAAAVPHRRTKLHMTEVGAASTALSPGLQRLAGLSGGLARGDEEKAVRDVLKNVNLADFGAAADGWPRCYRSTRIVLLVLSLFPWS